MGKKTKFALVIEGTVVPIYVVGNMSWGGKQQVIVYESPGTNGGTVVTTGRLNRQRTLNGKMIHVEGTTLQQIKSLFFTVMEDGTPVTLLSPIDDEDTGQYIIEEFNGNIIEGTESYLPFTMVLTEYRQANIRRSQINLISFEPAEAFKQRLRDQQLLT